jgi:tRNA-dependent cyclodipeptide synthase
MNTKKEDDQKYNTKEYDIQIAKNGQGLARLIGYKVVENKGTGILFISPENSYYSEENIHKQLECCLNSFSQVYVMIPEGPLVHNYLAMGYEKIDAERKARLKCNNLKNKARRGIDLLVENNINKPNVIDWKQEREGNDYYKKELDLFSNLYKTDGTFQDDVNNMASIVLGKKANMPALTNNSIEEASKYVIEELAFMHSAPMMLNVKELTYVYHKEWPIFENYVNGKYLKKEEQKIGLVVIN